MPSIVKEDHDALNASLTVNITKDDYLEDFNKELKKYRKHAALKGFRKGKTPMSVVRKMFGRSILGEVVNKTLEKELTEYLYSGEIDMLGQPIPSDEQAVIDFDLADMGDYEFKFDLGIAPSFELKGLDESTTFDRLKVSPDEEKLQEELMNLRRRMGESQEVEAPVEEEDIITVHAVELVDSAPKEGGVENEFTLFVRNASANVQAELIGKEIEAQLEVNIYELEENNSESHVRKYLLGLEEEDDREISPTFSLTIKKVSRFELAELNDEFFEKAFAEGDVSSEEEALAKIADDYNRYYTNQVDALLFRDFQEHLMEEHQLELPDEFLKRWLVLSSEQNTPETVEAGYIGFAKNLQWTLIRQKLVERLEVKVEEEEVRAAFAEQVKGYFGGQNPEWLNDEMISGMVDRMMGQQKEVEQKFEELATDKIHDGLKEIYTINDTVVTPDELEARMAEARAKVEAETALMEAVEEEE